MKTECSFGALFHHSAPNGKVQFADHTVSTQIVFSSAMWQGHNAKAFTLYKNGKSPRWQQGERVKDKIDKEKVVGPVYHIHCADCDASYIVRSIGNLAPPPQRSQNTSMWTTQSTALMWNCLFVSWPQASDYLFFACTCKMLPRGERDQQTYSMPMIHLKATNNL